MRALFADVLRARLRARALRSQRRRDRTVVIGFVLRPADSMEYWGGLVEWLTRTVAAEHKINENDLNLFHVTDDPREVLQIVKSTRETKPELRKREAKGKDPAVIGEHPTVMRGLGMREITSGVGILLGGLDYVLYQIFEAF